MPENSPAASLRARINSRQPHTARIWNYWLGGRDHYEVDRAAGDRIRELHPGIGEYARADRLFLGRAVRHLVTACGIRQFLDIGTGLPTADNTHEVASGAQPERMGVPPCPQDQCRCFSGRATGCSRPR